MSALEFPVPMSAAAGRALTAHAAPRASLPVLAVAGAVATAMSVASQLTSDHVSSPAAHAVLIAWITVTYLVAGLVAWRRRPGNRFGALMTAASFGMFLSSLSASNVPVAYTVGSAFDQTAAVLFLHVFLAFPTGRLQGRLEHALVAGGYATAFGLQLIAMALGGLGPDNLLAVTSEPAAAMTVLRIELLTLTALAVVGMAILVGRRRSVRHRALRRSAKVLLESCTLALLMLAFLYSSAALGLMSGQAVFEMVRRATLFSIGLAPLAFLAGRLDARLARSAVGEVFVSLRGSAGPAELRTALARALRDPSLELAYWLHEFGGWADPHGRPVALPDGTGDRAATLVESNGAPVAALVHDAALRDERELLDAAAAAAAIALENAQLNVELLARLEELKGSRARIVEASDAERRRLERNLHDGAQQRLVAVALQLRVLRARVREDPDAAEELAAAAGEEVALSLNELRELARGLHPAVLEHGLAAALNALATRSPLPAVVACDIPRRLPQPVELAAYFVACEALANVAKYAQATSVSIRAWHDGRVAGITIADDGVGGADDARGSGLRGLADRVEALDGRLRVTSPPGAGTVVTAELPCVP